MARDLMRPSLEEMDRHPPELIEQAVHVHPDVRRVMRELGQGGWIGASFPSDMGGEQLPFCVSNACRFYFFAANYSAGVFTFLDMNCLK